jgi:UDP:flavonoid glycosyltransferase YjiC (YdhE family)
VPPTEPDVPIDVLYLADLSAGRSWAPQLAADLEALLAAGARVAWLPLGRPGAALDPRARGLATDRRLQLATPSGPPAARVVVLHEPSAAGARVNLPEAGTVLRTDRPAVERVLAALGPAGSAAVPPTGRPTAQPRGEPVLFVSSNGTGMGHLTRLMAMARRHSPGVRPVFASMSQAVPVVATEGFGWEYVPSRESLGIGVRRWNLQMVERFAGILARERPAALVFDGTYPYDAVLAAARAVPGLKLVWSRRGMWKPRGETDQLARSAQFDLIVEAGDLAAAADRGSTATRTDAVRVDPVTLLDEADLLPREQAAEQLGVDPSRPVALVTLGAGNNRDLTDDLGLFLTRLAKEPDVQVVLTRPVIATKLGPVAGQVKAVSIYPISRYVRAVDFAVSAAGYNSFHEFMQLAVPTAFVPNGAMPLDDQHARSRWAGAQGAAIDLPVVTPEAVDDAVGALVDDGRRAALAARCRELARPNGAGQAMAKIEELIGVRG